MPRLRLGSTFWTALLLAVLPLPAQAVLSLRLSDGITTVTLADGSALDLNVASGAVTYIGSIGAFSINVSTALGDDQTAFSGIHLDSLNYSPGAGSIEISMTETDLNFGAADPIALAAAFGGGSGGTIRGRVFADDANLAFSQAVQLFDSGTFNSGAFSYTADGAGVLSDPFSMSLVVDITHSGGNTTNFNFDVSRQVPEPASLALVAMALCALGATRRRRA